MIVSNAPHCVRGELFQNLFFHFRAVFELLKYSAGFCVSPVHNEALRGSDQFGHGLVAVG